jgi:hypothetical protein
MTMRGRRSTRMWATAARRIRIVDGWRPYTVVVNVPYRREDPAAFEEAFPGRDGLEETDDPQS